MAETQEQMMARRSGSTRRLGTASAATGATAPVLALIPLPGFRIAAGVALGVSAALKVAEVVKSNRDAKLTGDMSTIAGYIRRSARWSDEKRKKEIAKLSKDYEKHIEDGDKKILGKYNRDRDTWKIKKKTLEMKLAALGVNQYNAKKNPDQDLVKGDPATNPRRANRAPQDASTLPDAPTSALPLAVEPVTTEIPWTPILAVGGLAAVGLILLTRPQAAPPRSTRTAARPGGEV